MTAEWVPWFLWSSDLKENLESCCCAVSLAESGRSSVEMFCKVSSLGESCTLSSTHRSVEIIQKYSLNVLTLYLQVNVICICSAVFSDLLYRHRKLQLRLHHSGWASWCSCTCPKCLQLPVLDCSAWAWGLLTSQPTDTQMHLTSSTPWQISFSQSVQLNQTGTDLVGYAPGKRHLSPVCPFS